jgi:predicted MFS family arabinose efflux permease
VRRWNPAWLLIAYLWVCYVLNHADRQVVYTLFPALQQEFGYSDAVLGLTGALFLWVYALCSPAAGLVGDRWPKAKVVAGSLAVWSAFTVLSGLSPNGMFLLGCRALLGVSESLFMPAAYALMANAHGPETRSRAISIFATSQMVGVALGGSLSGYVAEALHWRASFFLLGGAGIAFAWPLWRFLRSAPAEFVRRAPAGEAPNFRSFLALFRIPTLRVVLVFVSVATFGLFLVYTWLPTFLYDKFSLGMARAGFEASVYPQIGTALGLLTGGWMADRLYRRTKAARYWVVVLAFAGAAPCLYLAAVSATLSATRLAVMGFGFFKGFTAANQAAAAFDVVPQGLRATTVGVLNFVGAGVSGFAPFLGGLARRTIGVDRVMSFTSAMFVGTGLLVIYGTVRHFRGDYERARGEQPQQAPARDCEGKRHFGCEEGLGEVTPARSPIRPPNRTGESIRPPCRILRANVCC